MCMFALLYRDTCVYVFVYTYAHKHIYKHSSLLGQVLILSYKEIETLNKILNFIGYIEVIYKWKHPLKGKEERERWKHL